MADSTTPRGLPILAACAALIYVPTLLVDAAFGLLGLARVVDDNLAEMGDE